MFLNILVSSFERPRRIIIQKWMFMTLEGLQKIFIKNTRLKVAKKLSWKSLARDFDGTVKIFLKIYLL